MATTNEKFSYLRKQERPSVVQIVIDSLTEAMIQGELRPGDKIPTELELSEQLGIARNSVREAIKMLAFLGVLEIRRPEGTFVCNGFSEAMINPMIYGIILHQGDSFESLMELREMTEVGVLRLVMKKASKEQLRTLDGPLKDLKECCLRAEPDVERAFEADNRFHEAIMALGNNIMISKINSIVRILTHAARHDTVSQMLTSGRGEELYMAHEAIYQVLLNCEQQNLNEVIRETYFQ